MFRRRTTAAEPLPTAGKRLDVQLDGEDESLATTVLEAEGATLHVTAGRTAAGRGIRVEPGTRLTLSWTDGTALFAVPARIAATSYGGGEPRWQLGVSGPVRRIQRRGAVRVQVRLPVSANAGGSAQAGTTIDLGEAGARLVLAGPPLDDAGEPVRTAGARLLVTLQLDGRTLTTEAELVRRHRRVDGRWEASVHFATLTETQKDTLRRVVFTELRDAEDR